jgi:hypothetical protein
MTAMLEEGNNESDERKMLHIPFNAPSSCRGHTGTGQPVRTGRAGSERAPFTIMNAPSTVFMSSSEMPHQEGANATTSSSISVSSAATTAEDSISTASSSASAELPMLSGLSLSGPPGMTGWDSSAFGLQFPIHQTYPPTGAPQNFALQSPHHFITPSVPPPADNGSHSLVTDAFQSQTQPQPRTTECDEDLFAMYVFKVAMCSKQFVHDWKECPYAHEGETAR